MNLNFTHLIICIIICITAYLIAQDLKQPEQVYQNREIDSLHIAIYSQTIKAENEKIKIIDSLKNHYENKRKSIPSRVAAFTNNDRTMWADSISRLLGVHSNSYIRLHDNKK